MFRELFETEDIGGRRRCSPGTHLGKLCTDTTSTLSTTLRTVNVPFKFSVVKDPLVAFFDGDFEPCFDEGGSCRWCQRTAVFSWFGFCAKMDMDSYFSQSIQQDILRGTPLD